MPNSTMPCYQRKNKKKLCGSTAFLFLKEFGKIGFQQGLICAEVAKMAGIGQDGEAQVGVALQIFTSSHGYQFIPAGLIEMMGHRKL